MTDADRARSGGTSTVLVALCDDRRAGEIARALAAEHLMPVTVFRHDALLDFATDPNVTAVVVDPVGLGVGRPVTPEAALPVPAPTPTEIVSRVRAVTSAPIVLLGFVPGDGWSQVVDGADGLLGADASPADVVGTVLTAIARRGPAEEVIACADLVVDLRNFEAWQGDRRLTLTPTELRLLGVLVAAKCDVVTKHDLQQAAWGSAGAHDDNRLQAHMRRLRHKLADADAGSPATGVRTVRGIGFRLEADPTWPTGTVAATTGESVHEPTETVERPSGDHR